MNPAIYPTLPYQPDSAMVARYWEDGYLAFLNVLTPEEVRAASEGINELVRKDAREADRRPGPAPYPSAAVLERDH